jgi:hypothetical protein
MWQWMGILIDITGAAFTSHPDYFANDTTYRAINSAKLKSYLESKPGRPDRRPSLHCLILDHNFYISYMFNLFFNFVT